MPPEKPNELTMDEILHLLTHDHRRCILFYLANHPDEKIGLQKVQEHLLENTEADEKKIEINLYHNHIPALEKADIITLQNGNIIFDNWGDKLQKTISSIQQIES